MRIKAWQAASLALVAVVALFSIRVMISQAQTIAGLVIQGNEFSVDIGLGLVDGVENFSVVGVSDAIATTEFTILAPNGGESYPYPATPGEQALAIRIAAGGNAADDAAGTGARSVRVWCLDENFDRIQYLLLTAGASASADSPGSCSRVNRVRLETVGTYKGKNAGGIVIESTGGVTLSTIPTDAGEAEQAVFTCPANTACTVVASSADVDANSPANIRIILAANPDVTSAPFAPEFIIDRQIGLAGTVVGGEGDGQVSFLGPSDIHVLVKGTTQNTAVSVRLIIRITDN